MASPSLMWFRCDCGLNEPYLPKKQISNSYTLPDFTKNLTGTFFMAPVFYGWMKYTSRFFKRKTLRTAITRAAIEQVSYSPLAMAYFFFGMSALERKPLKECVNEVREKWWPTYKIGVIFWPTAQTINFYCVSEKNRIIFVSMASFVWTVYLAHMKAKEQKNPLLGPGDSDSGTWPNFDFLFASAGLVIQGSSKIKEYYFVTLCIYILVT